MAEKSKLLEDVYKSGQYSFECNSEKQEMRSVVYGDAKQLVEAVIAERNFEGNVCVKLMIGGGPGFFKMVLSIF